LVLRAFLTANHVPSLFKFAANLTVLPQEAPQVYWITPSSNPELERVAVKPEPRRIAALDVRPSDDNGRKNPFGRYDRNSQPQPRGTYGNGDATAVRTEQGTSEIE
jgi:hypothetical protein